MTEKRQYPRLIFVDYLRMAAVAFMLQGHTFDALLSPDVKVLYSYKIFNLFHGLTAPMFLFSSGFAFAVSSIRNIDSYTQYSPKLERRYLRYFSLLLIGYFFHLPYFSLPKLIAGTADWEFEQFWNVDTLQCIGVSLLVLQTLLYALKSERKYLLATAALATLAFFLAPLAWNMPRLGWVHPGIASYFNGDFGSFFPLFPWFGFIAAGSVAGQFFLIASQSKSPEQYVLKMMIAGGLMILFDFILAQMNLKFYPIHDWYKTSPLYSFIRLGIIMFFCGFLWYAEKHTRRHAPESAKRHIRPLQMLGRESLMIYVAHLVVLYGSPLNHGAGSIVGPTLGFPQSVFGFGLLFVSMLLLANLWHELKNRFPSHVRFGLFATATSLGLLFVTRQF